jgi:mono/diheme cytochrome c family protein
MRPVLPQVLLLCCALSSLFGLVGLSGCNRKAGAEASQPAPPPSPPPTTPAPPSSPEVRKEAHDLYAGRCASCHGATGRGDGVASAALMPRPRNFQDRSWQANVTDEYIEKIIQHGGVALGKSPAMPPNLDLAGRPAVLAALREYIRELGK